MKDISYRYRFGTAEFDETKFELRVGGLPVDIERRPLDVLVLLLRRAGEVVTKEEFLTQVWGRPTVEKVLTNAIKKLRDALGASNAECILTQPRIGYRLNAVVERMAVGHSLSSRLELKVGSAVPNRPNFVLRRQLGATNGSEVWLAEHQATKEPRVYKFAADGTRLSSLKREATLSRVLLDTLGASTAFPQLLDWNFEHAPFFLECEYGGPNLLDWSLQSDALQAMDRQQRLDLFLQIADAVASAHSVGVLHKDLKPSNVLISHAAGHWQLRVTDFGSGRLLDPDRLDALGITQLGLTGVDTLLGDSTSGTPLYLAPELIGGHSPTVQSDVYALGILLYQTQTGDLMRPMASGWARDIDDELLRSDLLAATDGSPALRLSSVAELLTRLRSLNERRQSLEKVRAATDSARLTEELLSRNRARRPFIIATIIALSTGMTASTAFGVFATQARHAAEREAKRADAINHFLTNDILGSVQRPSADSGKNPSMREVLDRSSEKLSARLKTDTYTKAGISYALAMAYDSLEDYEQADRLFGETIKLIEQAGSPSPELLARALYYRANIAVRLRRSDVARSMVQEADRATGTRLDQPTTEALLSRWMHSRIAQFDFDYALALTNIEAAERLRQEITPEDSMLELRFQRDAVDSLIGLGRFQEAEARSKQVMSDRRFTEAGHEETLADLQSKLAIAVRAQMRFEEALGILLECIAKLERYSGRLDAQTIKALGYLGALYGELNDPKKSLGVYEEVYNRAVEKYGKGHRKTLVDLANLGDARAWANDLPGAIRDLRVAYDGLRKEYGDDNGRTVGVGFLLARNLSNGDRHAEAWDVVRHFTPEQLTAAIPGPAWPARLDAFRGMLLLKVGRSEEGVSLLRRGVQGIREAQLPADELAPYESALLEHEATLGTHP